MIRDSNTIFSNTIFKFYRFHNLLFFLNISNHTQNNSLTYNYRLMTEQQDLSLHCYSGEKCDLRV